MLATCIKSCCCCCENTGWERPSFSRIPWSIFGYHLV